MASNVQGPNEFAVSYKTKDDLLNPLILQRPQFPSANAAFEILGATQSTAVGIKRDASTLVDDKEADGTNEIGHQIILKKLRTDERQEEKKIEQDEDSFVLELSKREEANTNAKLLNLCESRVLWFPDQAKMVLSEKERLFLASNFPFFIRAFSVPGKELVLEGHVFKTNRDCELARLLIINALNSTLMKIDSFEQGSKIHEIATLFTITYQAKVAKTFCLKMAHENRNDPDGKDLDYLILCLNMLPHSQEDLESIFQFGMSLRDLKKQANLRPCEISLEVKYIFNFMTENAQSNPVKNYNFTIKTFTKSNENRFNLLERIVEWAPHLENLTVTEDRSNLDVTKCLKIPTPLKMLFSARFEKMLSQLKRLTLEAGLYSGWHQDILKYCPTLEYLNISYGLWEDCVDSMVEDLKTLREKMPDLEIIEESD